MVMSFAGIWSWTTVLDNFDLMMELDEKRGDINIRTKFHGSPFNSCRDISLKTSWRCQWKSHRIKVVFWPTDRLTLPSKLHSVKHSRTPLYSNTVIKKLWSNMAYTGCVTSPKSYQYTSMCCCYTLYTNDQYKWVYRMSLSKGVGRAGALCVRTEWEGEWVAAYGPSLLARPPTETHSWWPFSSPQSLQGTWRKCFPEINEPFSENLREENCSFNALVEFVAWYCEKVNKKCNYCLCLTTFYITSVSLAFNFEMYLLSQLNVRHKYSVRSLWNSYHGYFWQTI